jgi:hypothetical protein
MDLPKINAGFLSLTLHANTPIARAPARIAHRSDGGVAVDG